MSATEALRRAHEATTQGEWHLVPYGDGDSIVICEDEAGNRRIAFMPVPGSRDARERKLVWRQIQQNAHFIALAHKEVPALCDRVEALETLLHDLFAGETVQVMFAGNPIACEEMERRVEDALDGTDSPAATARLRAREARG